MCIFPGPHGLSATAMLITNGSLCFVVAFLYQSGEIKPLVRPLKILPRKILSLHARQNLLEADPQQHDTMGRNRCLKRISAQDNVFVLPEVPRLRVLAGQRRRQNAA